MTAPQDHGDPSPAAGPDDAATLAPPPVEPEELPASVDVTSADDDIVDAEVVPTPNISFVPPVRTPRFDYTDAGVPTLDYLRDKIEGRYGTALGGTELAQESRAGQDEAQREADRTKAARDKLDEIRRSLHPEG